MWSWFRSYVLPTLLVDVVLIGGEDEVGHAVGVQVEAPDQRPQLRHGYRHALVQTQLVQTRQHLQTQKDTRTRSGSKEGMAS